MMAFVWHWLAEKASKLKYKILGIPEPETVPLDPWSSESPFQTWAIYSKMCFAVSVLLFAAFLILYCYTRETPQVKSVSTRRRAAVAVYSYPPAFHTVLRTWLEGFALFLVLCLILTVPWEWVRLYQIEMARKMAVLSEGLPYKCKPEELAFWDAIKAWFSWPFAWNTDACENYHRALVVDPFWEVTPLMAISSAVGRIIIHPVEQLSQVAGKSLRYIMKEVPSQWQPFVFLMFPISLFVLSIAFFFKTRTSVMTTDSKKNGLKDLDKANYINQRKSKALKICNNN